MSKELLCPICENLCPFVGIDPSNATYEINCKICGKFFATDVLLKHRLFDELKPKRYLISSIIRERNYLNLNTVLGYDPKINSEEEGAFKINEFLNFHEIPGDPEEKLKKLLSYVKQKTNDSFGLRISLNPAFDYPLAYAHNETEFVRLIYLAKELSFISFPNSPDGKLFHDEVSLTNEGWKLIDTSFKKPAETNQAFIAMWFSGYNLGKDHQKHKDITKADRDLCYLSIEKAFEQTPYFPSRIDRKEHNEKICDKIIVEIKNSKFVVADVTGNRGGVYFEAGYAKSLGLDVIWLCKKGFEDDMHFDTDHYNHIIYSDYDDLTEKLKNRILGSIN